MNMVVLVYLYGTEFIDPGYLKILNLKRGDIMKMATIYCGGLSGLEDLAVFLLENIFTCIGREPLQRFQNIAKV